MSIKRRIWALPAISIVILSLGLAVTLYFSSASVRLIRAAEQVDYPALEATKALALQVQTVANSFKDVVAENDQKRLDQIGTQGDEVRAQLKRLGNIPGRQDQARQLAAEFEEYLGSATKAARLMLELEQGDVQQAIPHMQSSLKTLEDDLGRSVAASQRQFSGGIESSNDSVRKVMQTSIVVALATVASLMVVSYFVIRTIWRQLGGEPEYARAIARAVASGDLSLEILAERDDSLLGALKEMQGKLAGMVSGIKASASTVAEASAELAAGNADLSSRTDAQASSLEQTASAMAALTDTVKQNAEHAWQANQLVGTAANVAVKGGDVVGQVVDTMSEINASSQEIADIISVIDGIAFQTNILALNAAVEAARAGEQGRGFAVVAAEVRSLAQRSAGAAKEIKELIGSSVEKIGQGSRLVDQAGTTMTEIVAAVERVTGIMGEIAAASEAQRTGIMEVNQAICQMDQMTQQNSALVEEVAASTEALQDDAAKLNTTLAVFKLSRATASGAAHKPAPMLALVSSRPERRLSAR